MSSIVSLDYYTRQLGTTNSGITEDGGFYQTFINNTGSASVKGTIVTASSTDNAVIIAPANSVSPIGIIYDNGIANGSSVKVVTYGRAQVLLLDGSSSTAGYWCGVSSTAGRFYNLPSPPNDSSHSREVGHSLQTVSSGTNKLVYVQIHFN